jgi:hypothetical protein
VIITTASTLVRLAIAAITILVVVGFMYYVSVLMEHSGEIKECQTSIQAYLYTRDLTVDYVKPELNCPTKYSTITSGDKEKIMEEMFDRMQLCWVMWGRGHYLFLERQKSGAGTFIREWVDALKNFFAHPKEFWLKGSIPEFENFHYCHICDVIDFEHKDIMISAEEVNAYANKNKIGDKTMREYFRLVTAEGSASNAREVTEQSVFQPDDFSEYTYGSIDTSKTYAIIFHQINHPGPIRNDDSTIVTSSWVTRWEYEEGMLGVCGYTLAGQKS